jgi:hypothetical protein
MRAPFSGSRRSPMFAPTPAVVHRRCLVVASEDDAHADSDRRPFLETHGEHGIQRQCRELGSLHVVPSDPPFVVFQVGGEARSDREAGRIVGADPVRHVHAQHGSEPPGVTAVASRDVGPREVGCLRRVELGFHVRRLESQHELRPVEDHHAGGVPPRGRRVQGEGGASGGRGTEVRRAHLVEPGPRSVRSRGAEGQDQGGD